LARVVRPAQAGRTAIRVEQPFLAVYLLAVVVMEQEIQQQQVAQE
jgi:hypothetical protein